MESSSCRPLFSQRPSCPRCRSSDTRFCYFTEEDDRGPRPKHFCLSCYKFWVEEETPEPPPPPPPPPPLHVATSIVDGPSATPDAPQPPKRRRTPEAEHHPLLPCPRCHSPHTRFLKYQSRGRTRPQHYCFSCGRCWLVGATRHWSWGKATAAPSVARPRCPRCGSPHTRGQGSCPADRTRRRHACLACRRSWTRVDDAWTEVEAHPVATLVPPLGPLSLCSSSQPVVDLPEKNGHAAQDGTLGGGAAAAAAAADQIIASAVAALQPFLDMDGNPKGDTTMRWEDIELIDNVLECYMKHEYLAAISTLEGQ